MSHERPDIPVLTVSWINNRLKEMAADQTANEVDGEYYIDHTGHAITACWQYLRDTLREGWSSMTRSISSR